MKSKPVISVIMPVYNCEEYLRDSISSILCQTYTDFEFIIVNDGSSDSSLGQIKRFAKEDSRIKIVSRGNKGLVASLNEGLSLARGEFIARMDADDVALPSRFVVQLEYFKSHPEIDILGGQARAIDEKGQPAGLVRKPIKKRCIRESLKYSCPLIHPTYMVRKDVFRNLKGYRDLVSVEDLDFLLRACESGYKIGNVPNEVLLYRINSAGMSSRHILRQMRSTRLLLVDHRRRMSGIKEPLKIDKLVVGEGASENSMWFGFWYQKRNRLLSEERGRLGLMKMLGIVFCSLMHYELFFASYRAAQALRWKR